MTAFAKTASWLHERDEARPDFFANSALSSIRDNLKSLMGGARAIVTTHLATGLNKDQT